MTVSHHDDPSTRPRHDHGWSRKIVVAKNAIVVPPTRARYRKPAGVLFEDGSCCEHSLVWRFNNRLTTVPGKPKSVETTLQGRWLWGGVLFNHFGHFLVESLARFWALDRIDDVRGIVFIPKRPRQQRNLLAFQAEVLDCFDRALEVRMVSEPTSVEELVIPGQGLGLGPTEDDAGSISSGTPEMRSYMHDHFAKAIEEDGGGLLYVSRSRLGLVTSGLLGEDRLEVLLSAEGYEIFHPETVDVATQVARYKAARKIVFSDGSAAHLFAFVGRADQSVAYICRRSRWIDGPVQQIAGFVGRAPLVLTCLDGEWLPRKDSGYRRVSLGQLDLPELGRQLEHSGFVSNGSNWPRLEPSEITAILAHHDLSESFMFIGQNEFTDQGE